MSDYWWNTFYSQETRDWFSANIDQLKVAQPDAYEANFALAQFLGLDVAQTFGVSAVADLTTYCTSILARTDQGEIIHARNLDFYFTDVMKKLVYEAVLSKDGQVKAKSPLIAGFYGSYTGQKKGVFSISYNVREHASMHEMHEEVQANLQRNLDVNRVPQHTAVLNVLLNAQTFDEAVLYLEQTPITSRSHFVVGGVSGNEGVVLSRDADDVVRKVQLTQESWFLVMTNLDSWTRHDARYEKAVSLMS